MKALGGVSIIIAISSLAWAAEDGGLSQEVLQLRDPFKRPASAIIKQEFRTPLEEFSSEQFKMVGVITGMDRLRAIIVDPNGKTHFVSEKMKIGSRRGVIRRITRDSIQVREQIVNVLGKNEAVDVEIRLPDETATAAPPVVVTEQPLPGQQQGQ